MADYNFPFTMRIMQAPIDSTIDTLELSNAIFDDVIISNNLNFDYELTDYESEATYTAPYLTHEQMISNNNIIKKYSIPATNAFSSSTLIFNAWMPYEAFDLSFDSQWGSNIPSKNGEYIGIDLEEKHRVNEVVIAWSESPDNNLIYYYANTVQIQVSSNGIDWKDIPTNYGTIIQQSANYGMRYMLDTPVETRYIRVLLTNPNEVNGYRIREIAIIEDSSVYSTICPKYPCSEYVNITDYPKEAEKYLSYVLLNESFGLIAEKPIHKGNINTLGASYISFSLSSEYHDNSSVRVKFQMGEPNSLYFPEEWDKTIKLHAQFHNNIFAGGLAYDVNQAQNDDNYGFLLKRRAVNDILWTNIGYINNSNFIIDEDLLTSTFIDRSAFPNENYEYMVVSIFKGEELGGGSISTVARCCTDGIAISEIDKTYYTPIEAKISGVTQNKGTTIVETFHSKYPFAFKNGETNYSSGSASGMFVPIVDKCKFIFANENSNNAVWKYRQEFREWLCNGKPKILKYYDGRTKLVSINETVTDDDGEYNDKNITTFNWTEIGDITSTDDLISNGLMNEY